MVSMICFAFSYGVVSTYVAIYAKDELNVRSGTGLFFSLLAIGLILSRFQGAHALRAGRIAHNADVGLCFSLVGLLILHPCIMNTQCMLPLLRLDWAMGTCFPPIKICLLAWHQIQNVELPIPQYSFRGIWDLDWECWQEVWYRNIMAITQHFGWHG